MSTLKQSIKQIIPQPLWNLARNSRDGLIRMPESARAFVHPRRRDAIRRLAALQDLHRGKRCFIIGNGPSLRQTDISRLKNEYTFGVNRIYLAFQDWGFTTSYYLSINDLVIEQCAEDIGRLPMPKFIAWHAHKNLAPADDLFYLYTTYTGPKFAEDVRGRVWEGATVTYVALQVAYYLGFQTVILVGVDHSFTTQGKPNTTIVSQGDDPNHFHAGYFGKGFRWQLPDLETSERAYHMARKAYQANGRQVLDATIGGKLTVFPKVDYNSLF